MTLNEFRSRWLGKKADWDGAYGGQCVDLFRFYVHEVLNQPQPKGVTGAADFWTNYPTDPNLNKYFDRIANTPNGIPQAGDVMVWNKNAGGGYGHISIYLKGDVNSFVSLDQNWPTLNKVTETNHNYNNVLGWLRPKKGHMPDEGSIVVPKKQFEELVTKATGFDEYAKQFQSPAQAKQLIDQLKADVAGANEAKKEQEKRAEEWRKVLNSHISELATLLDTRQEYAEIKANIEGLVAKTDELQKYKEAHSGDSRKWAEQELKLNTEINRLNALLQDKNVLENVELAELIKELIKRFKRIINAR